MKRQDLILLLTILCGAFILGYFIGVCLPMDEPAVVTAEDVLPAVEPPKPEPVDVEPAPVVEEPELVSLGTFKLTHYCPCSVCCGKWADGITATGTTAAEGRTIAVDPKVIPLGSKVVINGWEYTAEDTGGAIKGNRIDVYMDSHEDALVNGVKHAEVFISKE